MNWSQTARLALASVLAVALPACNSEPTGQVLAVVNGDEITQAELNAEIAGLSLPTEGDKQEIRRQILQQLVDRRLMAQVATQEGFDRSPEFLNRERKLREELLVQMYSQKIAETVRVPDGPTVQKFLSENPGKFSERAIYTVDQIVFDFPSDPRVLKALEPATSLAEVEQTLTGFKVQFSRGQNSIDTRSLPAGVLKQILALPPGEPFVVPAQGRVTVSVITGKRPEPTSQEEAAPFAAQEIRTQSLSKVLESRLKEAKDKADISYQDGLAPTKQATSPKT